MKLKLFLLLALIALPFAVYADEGKTFELDFKVKNQYNLLLNKSDRVLFEYGGFNHTIIIDDIKANTTELDIFLFLGDRLHTPDYQFIGKRYDIKLDFDKDGEKEMMIKLLRNDIANGTTNILFGRLEAWDDDKKIDPYLPTEDDKSKIDFIPYIYYMVGAGITLLIILITFSFYYYNKRKGIYY